MAAVLLPLGTWLALIRPAREDEPARRVRPIRIPVLLLGAAVGCVGGIYGLGGSILALIAIGALFLVSGLG